MDHLKKYFERFSCRACCFSDMKKYLPLLEEQERQDVSNFVFHVFVLSCCKMQILNYSLLFYHHLQSSSSF